MAEATADTRVPVLSFSCLITDTQTAGVRWGVPGSHSAPRLEPALTTDRAPAQIRDNPESLRARGCGNVLVPFFLIKFR